MNKFYEQASKNANSMNGTIVAFAQEPNSVYLHLAIVHFPVTKEFTVYGYNAEFDGFYSGDYYMNNDSESAYKRFCERLLR